MSYTKKPFEELDVIDDFLMNAIATDPEVGEPFCRKTLSVLLQRNIGKIKIVSQRVIPAATPEHRGIRIDVEVEELSDEESTVMNIYDIEPHTRNSDFLPKRNRFYQAKIDGRYLRSGEKDFDKLPDLYVITITNYDPFGADYMMYTFRNRCVEVPDLPYEDGLQFIYFNTTGTLGGSEEIRKLLDYIQNSKEDSVTDDTTRELHEYVRRVRVQPEVKLEYMRFDEIIEYERGDAAQEATLDTKRESVLELLEEYGELPQSLCEQIEAEKSVEVLKNWHKLAAKVETIEEFLEKM